MDNKIPSTEELGHVIRDARKEQNLTQDDLAGITGTGRRFIGDLENGKETAEIGKVLLVLGALGIAIYALSKWGK